MSFRILFPLALFCKQTVLELVFYICLRNVGLENRLLSELNVNCDSYFVNAVMAHRPDSQEEAFDYLFKLVLIGDAGVGKTCVVQRFMGSAFVERHSSTIGVDFTMRTVVIDGKRVKV